VRHEPDGTWFGNFRLPPGLGGGWNDVRLRLADSDFGRTLRVAVDMPAAAPRRSAGGACDGNNFTVNTIAVGERGWVSPGCGACRECATRDNIRVLLDSTRLSIDFVGDEDF